MRFESFFNFSFVRGKKLLDPCLCAKKMHNNHMHAQEKKSFKVHILLFVLTAFYSHTVPHLEVIKLTKLSVLFNHNHQFYIKTINDNKRR